MSHYEELMKTARAFAFKKGLGAVAASIGAHDDTVRRLLGDHPPKAVKLLKAIEELAATEPTEP